jgi:hypothetical protein
LLNKVFSLGADGLFMTNPISSSHVSHTEQASQPARPQPSHPTDKSTLPQDTVTLKSTGGDADHDGDSK